jgi:hypothetical protein
MTKDEQWTIKDNLTEEEAISFWNENISGNTSSLDRIIQSQDGQKTFEIENGRLVDCAEIYCL